MCLLTDYALCWDFDLLFHNIISPMVFSGVLSANDPSPYQRLTVQPIDNHVSSHISLLLFNKQFGRHYHHSSCTFYNTSISINILLTSSQQEFAISKNSSDRMAFYFNLESVFCKLSFADGNLYLCAFLTISLINRNYLTFLNPAF